MSEEKYAFIKDGEVVNVVLFDDPDEFLLSHFKSEFTLDEILLATDTAAIGGTYDGSTFWSPQPYPSWVKGDTNWEPPVAYPEDDKVYEWDESTVSWKETEQL